MAGTWEKLAFDGAVVKHSLATAENDFLVASGAGAYVKKTLAETKTILGYTDPASIEPGHKHYKLWASDGSPEAMTVDAAGNVGIGTTGPEAQLSLSTTATSAAVKTYTYTNDQAIINGYRLSGDPFTRILDIVSEGHAASGIIRFLTTVGAADATERMRIDGSGRVGIGGVAPIRQLMLSQGVTGWAEIGFNNAFTGYTAADGCAVGLYENV